MDQCKNCNVRGNLEKCLKTSCPQHENWIVLQYVEKIEKMKIKIKELEIKCENKYDEGYDEGYDGGYDEGYDGGYDEGCYNEGSE